MSLSQVLADEYQQCHPTARPLKEFGFDPATSETERLKIIYRAIHGLTTKRSALCFSGGGIRSATFGLGVLKSLARLGILDRFDYLSTVSGGGYIGSWLTAWIKRTDLKTVSEELRKRPTSPLEPEVAPISWIRAYSNYLSPKLGLFSGDGWTLVGTYLRNVTLNWFILVPILAALLMFPRVYIALVKLSIPAKGQWALLSASLALALLGLTYVHLYRPSLVADCPAPSSRTVPTGPALWYQRWSPRSLYRFLKRAESPSVFTWFCLFPLVATVLLLTICWSWYVNTWPAGMVPSVDLFLEGRLPAWLTFGVVAAVLHLTSWTLSGCWLFYAKPERDLAFVKNCKPMYTDIWWLLKELGVVGVSGFVGGTLLWALLNPSLLSGTVAAFAEWYTCVTPLLVIGIYLVTATLFIGFSSQYTREEDREWWGRAGSWMLASGFAWLALASIVILIPALIEQLPRLIGSVGGVSGLLALYFGFSSKTRAQEDEGRNRSVGEIALGLLPKLSAPIFVVFLLGLLSLGTSSLLEYLSLSFGPTADISSTRWDVMGIGMPKLPSAHLYVLHATSLNLLLVVLACSLGLSFLMAWFVNINTFSLHALYRNRLVRAYLGASQAQRKANPFSGFDAADNLEIKDLVHKPFHVINAALNLVHGDNIAWQERKAHSFTISPLHCGSAVHTAPRSNVTDLEHEGQLGYRRSSVYGVQRSGAGNKSITLGTALAISGAAASPNMGYHSSAPVAFLLTLFNIRLGWWLGNPGEAGERMTFALKEPQKAYQAVCPNFALFPLFAEALGFTDSCHPYVYLSDGGHFENLGLYEMVLRRCHCILVVDASCDPTYKFEDLGNAIRKIRVDLGIDIEIDTTMVSPDKTTGLTAWHHAIGKIRYDKVDDEATVGTLIYLKPSLTGDEPSDVREYASKRSVFPHEPTADQFFSESQFESYRGLGEHAAWEVLRHASPQSSDASGLCEALKSHWVTMPPGIQTSFLRDTQTLIDLENMLRTDPTLAKYDLEMYPELTKLFGMDIGKLAELDTRSALHMCNMQLQLMENVLLAVKLDENHAHSFSQGWMNLFRRWSAAPTLRAFWPTLRATYNREFVEFAEAHLDLPAALAIDRYTVSDGFIQQIVEEFALETPGLREEFRQALRQPLSLGKAGPALWIAKEK
ncbi:MAG: patatin-like phospholipase family protein, partial [Nitrospira defluvii]|nr:patatin-like phospholipase family protein [Nitrospira defluvii]